MTDENVKIKVPVAWLPAGLISWYAPGGTPVALVTSWVALIGGKSPRLRTSWHGSQDSLSRFWSGGDFVYNVPHEFCLGRIRDVMRTGRLCLDVKADLDYNCQSGIASVAPRLISCMVQLECINGRLVESGGESELCGDVVRLHRGRSVLNPIEIPDLCAIQPFGPIAFDE